MCTCNLQKKQKKPTFALINLSHVFQVWGVAEIRRTTNFQLKESI